MGNITPELALEKMLEGNKRFVSEQFSKKNIGESRRKELTSGQSPFAIVLTCSDSRVSPELIFDQGLGDIFVIRVAGNVVDDVITGSVEYAVEHLNSPLVVVLGHQSCGAVNAAVGGGEAPGSIGSIVERIMPSVEKVKCCCKEEHKISELVADENIKVSIKELEKSSIMQHFMKENKVKIVGAKYMLDSGKVELI